MVDCRAVITGLGFKHWPDQYSLIEQSAVLLVTAILESIMMVRCKCVDQCQNITTFILCIINYDSVERETDQVIFGLLMCDILLSIHGDMVMYITDQSVGTLSRED